MTGLLTTAEIAKKWGCTQRQVQALCKRGQLNAVLMGNSYVVRERDVDGYEHKPRGRPSQKSTRRHKVAKRGQKRRSGSSTKS